jgi:hypothetical protein
LAFTIPASRETGSAGDAYWTVPSNAANVASTTALDVQTQDARVAPWKLNVREHRFAAAVADVVWSVAESNVIVIELPSRENTAESSLGGEGGSPADRMRTCVDTVEYWILLSSDRLRYNLKSPVEKTEALTVRMKLAVSVVELAVYSTVAGEAAIVVSGTGKPALVLNMGVTRRTVVGMLASAYVNT